MGQKIKWLKQEKSRPQNKAGYRILVALQYSEPPPDVEMLAPESLRV
ncbi:MAG TPA: hypothetical protein VK138_10215 [Acidiferrobacterales bacterium]|nr:hypothetical protein [Acidiferrobacterales bacterium]